MQAEKSFDFFLVIIVQFLHAFLFLLSSSGVFEFAELDQLNSLSEGIIVRAFIFWYIWSSVACQVKDFSDARILRWYIDLVDFQIEAFQIEAFFITVQLCMAILGALDYLICLGAWIVDGYS